MANVNCVPQTIRHTKEMSRTKSTHVMEIQEAYLKIEKLQRDAVPVDRDLNGKLAALHKENEELKVQIRVVKEELEDVRRQKEHAAVEKEVALADCSEQIHRYKEEEMSMRRQLEMATRRVRHLEQELDLSVQNGESQHKQIVALHSSQAALQAQFDQEARGRRQLEQSSDLAMVTAQKEWESERIKLEAIAADKERALEINAAAHSEEIEKIQEECRGRLAKAEEAHLASKRAWEAEKAEILSRLQTAQVRTMFLASRQVVPNICRGMVSFSPRHTCLNGCFAVHEL